MSYRFPEVLAEVEELTLVVIDEAHPRYDVPYAGQPPAHDACHVFAQHPDESSFLFDLRLRECMIGPNAVRGSMARAVLVCGAERNDRELLRRTRLIASRVQRGGSIVLAYDRDTSQVGRLERLAAFVSSALSERRVTIQVLPLNQLTVQSAPLTAAWERVQRFRNPIAEAATSPTACGRPAPRRTSITLRATRKRASWRPLTGD